MPSNGRSRRRRPNQRQQIANHGGGDVHAPMYVGGDYVIAYGLARSAPPMQSSLDQEEPVCIGSPIPPSPLFAGRASELRFVCEQLDGSNSAGVRVVVLHGLGGVGKTEIAVEYAAAHASTAQVYWVDASSRSAVGSQFASIANHIGVEQVASVVATCNAVKAALGQRSDYILVFDNAEDSSVLRNLLPVTGGGRVLVTSVNPNWRDIGSCLEVLPLEEPAAVTLLEGRAGRYTEHASAIRLASALGHLPLALTQAGAYCSVTGRSFEAFVALLETEHQGLWDLPIAERSSRTLPTVFQLAVDAASGKCETARHLITYLSFVPLSGALLHELEADWSSIQRSVFNRPTMDDLALPMSALRSYSLIGLSPERVSVHPMVGQHVRQQALPRWRQGCIYFLMRSASKRLPLHTWRADFEMVAPAADQVLVLKPLIDLYGIRLKATSGTFDRAARFYASRWMHEESYMLTSWSLDNNVRTPDRLMRAARNLRSLGRGDEAAALFEELLEALPPTTAERRFEVIADYASSLMEVDNFEAGRLWYGIALQEAEGSFGRPSTAVATLSARLAAAYRRKGQYEIAGQMFEIAIDELERLGHVDTIEMARTMGSFGRCCTEAGQPARAVPYAQEAVRIKRGMVPFDAKLDDRPSQDLAQSLLGLAAAHAALGEAEGCEDALREAEERLIAKYGEGGAELCQPAVIRAQLALEVGSLSDARLMAEKALQLASENPKKLYQERAAAQKVLSDLGHQTHS